MKKRVLAALVAAAMMLTAVPVMATENPDDTVVEGEQDLTNIENAGSTAVEADILGEEDPGAVSYIIAIPERIDFGTLQMPTDDSVAHPKQVAFDVEAIEIIGVDAATQRVAVLMHDAATTDKTFVIRGASGTNNSKTLNYNVLSSAGIDVTNGVAYPNGYLFAAFSAAGQKISGTLSLDQNQLLSDTNLANWAGDYLGTINFYTAIATISDYV